MANDYNGDFGKFLSKKSYEHRSRFFREEGENLVLEAINKYSLLYPQLYSSSTPKENDFENKNLFDFIEQTLHEKIDSDFKINQDHELLIPYRYKFYSQKERNELIKESEKGLKKFGKPLPDYFPFYTTHIPVQIRELLKENTYILEEFYKACINSHIEQFFIRGRVSKYWISLDTVYRNGFNSHLTDFKYMTLNEIDAELQNCSKGSSGRLRNSDLHAKYQTLKNEEIKVQLLKFNLSKKDIEETVITNSILGYLELSPIKYIPNENHLDKYICSKYEPNNIVRDLLNLPRIGEGWISETKLYYQLKQYFNNDVVLQHIKPKWLGRQHFDIYFPLKNIAIEYQGKQHFEPVNYFGGSDAFKKNIERDKLKKELSKRYNCELFYVEPGYDINKVLEKIMNSENYNK